MPFFSTNCSPASFPKPHHSHPTSLPSTSMEQDVHQRRHPLWLKPCGKWSAPQPPFMWRVTCSVQHEDSADGNPASWRFSAQEATLVSTTGATFIQAFQPLATSLAMREVALISESALWATFSSTNCQTTSANSFSMKPMRRKRTSYNVCTAHPCPIVTLPRSVHSVRAIGNILPSMISCSTVSGNFSVGTSYL